MNPLVCVLWISVMVCSWWWWTWWMRMNLLGFAFPELLWSSWALFACVFLFFRPCSGPHQHPPGYLILVVFTWFFELFFFDECFLVFDEYLWENNIFLIIYVEFMANASHRRKFLVQQCFCLMEPMTWPCNVDKYWCCVLGLREIIGEYWSWRLGCVLHILCNIHASCILELGRTSVQGRVGIWSSDE